MNYLYALFREGIYRHECGGVFTDIDSAKAAIKKLRDSEPDDYHSWKCIAFEPNKVTPVYSSGDKWLHKIEEPGEIDIQPLDHQAIGMSMKTHFDPYTTDEDEPERAMCGTVTPVDGYSITASWGSVTCGHCLRRRSKINLQVESIEKDIVDQMGDFVDWCNAQKSQLTSSPDQ